MRSPERGDLLPSIEIEPTEAGEAASVVWLHGLGASGHDFEPIVPLLHLGWARFVLPHAPARPVTINNGVLMPAWYDIEGLGKRGANPQHVAESKQQTEALMARERDRGVPSRRIVLAGFSQGGAIALYTGLRHSHPLGGVLVLSSYEILPESLEEERCAENEATPLLFCHGSDDPMVPVERGQAACEARVAEDRPTEWHEFAMGHEVCLEEIELIARWLRERLPQHG